MPKQPLYANRYLKRFDNDMLRIINTIQLEDGVKLNYLQRHYVWFIVFHLKRIGVWDKVKALYGFIGGTAATHRCNWKDIRDLDEAYRLSFLGGGWIHDSNGIKPNGNTSYADTFLIPDLELRNNISIGVYSLTDYYTNNFGSFPQDIGTGTDVGEHFCYLMPLYADFMAYYDARESGFVNYQETNSLGMYIGTTKDNLNSLYKNGLLRASAYAENIVTDIPNSFTLAKRNGSLVSTFSPRQQCFAFISEGLTDLQAKQMSRIVISAQAILGRQ